MKSMPVFDKQMEMEPIGYLPIQKWFMAKTLPAANHFNHSFLIYVNEKTDKERVQRALEKLNRRHSMLRAVYRDGKQYIRKESPIAEIRELDIRGKKEDEIFHELTQWQSGFDTERGYIWQCGILRGYADGSERIYLAFHHLVFDAASWPIIREELKALYEGREVENNCSSYPQWVEAVKEYGKTATAEERQYWLEWHRERQEHQQDEWQELAEKDDRELRYSRVDFSAEISRTLFQTKRSARNTDINDVLLSGLSYALYEVSGKKQNWITVEKDGRDKLDNHTDISRTVGWFTTLFPLCLSVGKDIDDTIERNRNSQSRVRHKAIGYGAIHGYEQLPEILFNYLEHVGGTEEKFWQIRMGESSGESMNPDNRFGNIVEINGLSREGKTGFGVESCLKEESHRLLCEAFKKNVEKITSYLNP